ncbi:MAG TPA: hypothetical protein VMP89_05990 [Solirubrobacteraceae bacterium]|nr:hypothetical protein [Solirubrobacteraceae bacterium]
MPTHQRARKSRENDEYAAMMNRLLRAWGKRLADADDWDMAEFASFALEVDLELVSIVAAWRAAGRSWTDVGRALGITRQAAQQRFGHRLTHSG